jgi:hypothetical protein
MLRASGGHTVNLPSIVYILSEAKRAGLRFPFALISAVTAAVCAMILIDFDGREEPLVRVLMSTQPGIPLFIALTLFFERRGPGGRGPAAWWIAHLLGVAFLVAYYFTLPDEPGTVSITRFVQLNVGLHLLVAFSPYIGVADPNGFWQYNKTLFLRLLAGVIFSVTLFAGLSVALVAIDQLFGADIDEEVYFRLWIGVVFIFNTWYFIGGVPGDYTDLSTRRDYPPIIRVFAQYILSPLVAIYLAILLAYLVKVLVTTEWPSGWIGYLVSSVAAVGLFSLVLLHPLVEQAENRWVTTYARLFNIFMLPAILMLLMAIYKRVAQYGITENRYFLTVLTLWLTFVTIHGLVAKKRTIKIIPVSLCLVALVTSFGPWGAFSVSRVSQTNRLEEMLVANELMADGKLVPARDEVSFDDRKEIGAILDYLIDRHGVETISSMFDDALAVQVAGIDGGSPGRYRYHSVLTDSIMTWMNMEYVATWAGVDHKYYNFSRNPDGEPIDVAEYDVGYHFDAHGALEDSFSVDGAVYDIRLDKESLALKLVSNDEAVLELPLAPMVENLRDHYAKVGRMNEAPGTLLTTEATGDSLRAKLLVFDIQWMETDPGTNLQYLNAMILVDDLFNDD